MKKEKNINRFNSIISSLITDDELDYMHNVYYSNQNILLKCNEYYDADKKVSQLREQIETLPQEYSELFENFFTAFNTIYDYDLCLMYMIGFRKGIITGSIDKL